MSAPPNYKHEWKEILYPIYNESERGLTKDGITRDLSLQVFIAPASDQGYKEKISPFRARCSMECIEPIIDDEHYSYGVLHTFSLFYRQLSAIFTCGTNHFYFFLQKALTLQ